MSLAGSLLLAIAVAYGCAVVAPLIRMRARGKLAAWCMVPVVLACPWVIPPGNVGLRALAAVISGDLFFKMVDYFRRWDRWDRSTVLRNYYGLLIPFPAFAVVYPDHRRRLRRPESPGPQVVRV